MPGVACMRRRDGVEVELAYAHEGLGVLSSRRRGSSLGRGRACARRWQADTREVGPRWRREPRRSGNRPGAQPAPAQQCRRCSVSIVREATVLHFLRRQAGRRNPPPRPRPRCRGSRRNGGITMPTGPSGNQQRRVRACSPHLGVLPRQKATGVEFPSPSPLQPNARSAEGRRRNSAPALQHCTVGRLTRSSIAPTAPGWASAERTAGVAREVDQLNLGEALGHQRWLGGMMAGSTLTGNEPDEVVGNRTAVANCRG